MTSPTTLPAYHAADLDSRGLPTACTVMRTLTAAACLYPNTSGSGPMLPFEFSRALAPSFCHPIRG
jgi:hypothetical protein